MYLSEECIGPHITMKWGVFLLHIWEVLVSDFSPQRQTILTVGFHCFPVSAELLNTFVFEHDAFKILSRGTTYMMANES
jgi:hypothetical protein